MIVPIPRARRTSEENVLPLINIVFLLLIFFMMAGALSVTAPFPLEPPETDSAAAVDPPEGGVALGADGSIAFAGETISLDRLTDKARDWQASETADAILELRVDASASHEMLVQVIDRLRDAGIARIRLLAVGVAGDA